MRVPQQIRPTLRRNLMIGWGAIALLLMLIVLAFGWRPFKSGYVLNVEVDSTNQLKPGNPVRIAGLDVGKVESIDEGKLGKSQLSLRINKDSFVVRQDAKIAVRPRLFFEGAFYVDLQPGSPASAPLKGDQIIDAASVSRPVQLDQVLSSLPKELRTGLNEMLGTWSYALNSDGNAGSTAVKGTINELGLSLNDLQLLSASLAGRSPGDLTKLLSSGRRLAQQLRAVNKQTEMLVAGSGKTFAAMAGQADNLQRAVTGFAQLSATGTANLRAINSELPDLLPLLTKLQPTFQALPGSANDIRKLLASLEGATSKAELPALLNSARPLLSRTKSIADRLQMALPQVKSIANCINKQVYPVMMMQVPDKQLSNPYPVWLEAMHMGAALAGGSPSFDGNGTTIRIGTTAGDTMMEGVIPGIGNAIALSNGTPGGTSPWFDEVPDTPFRPDQKCEDQKLPDLSRGTGGPPLDLKATSRSADLGNQLQRTAGEALQRLNKSDLGSQR